MTRFDIFDTIEQLRREAQPFCVATVVRTADVTSAKAGAKAAVTADGEIIGHLGGGCVQRAVKATATEALESGQARMISVRPSNTDSNRDTDIQIHTSGCPSGGTVDLFIEPYRLAPRLWILGDTPIGRAIAEHGRLMGFQIELSTASNAAAIRPVGTDFIVIASQGSGDEAALLHALSSPAEHIGMIASRRKATVLKDRLAKQGITRARLDRLCAPAGLDLGGIDPHEIAISVLAQIVRWRRNGQTEPNDVHPSLVAE